MSRTKTMSRPFRLTPDWIDDLAQQWAREDWRDLDYELGYPSVSPMWRRIADVSSVDDMEGYSSAEIRAMAIAMDWLHMEHPDHWRALARQLRPHLRRALPATERDAELADAAGAMLAKKVDQLLDG